MFEELGFLDSEVVFLKRIFGNVIKFPRVFFVAKDFPVTFAQCDSVATLAPDPVDLPVPECLFSAGNKRPDIHAIPSGVFILPGVQ